MGEKYSINVTAKKLYRRKLFTRIAKLVFISLVTFVSVTYLFLYIAFDQGNFTVSLDKNMANRKSVYLSEDGSLENKTLKLQAESLDYMDNISIQWIPEDVDTEADGPHNGSNYIAYSFYTVHAGKDKVNYWYEINVDDSIRNVDSAIRIMIYQNGKPTVYAKKNQTTEQPEEGTKPFYSDDVAVVEQRKNFSPGDKDRYTIVIWIEGDDPDCTNDLIGGAIKMHMDITEEHIDKEK